MSKVNNQTRKVFISGASGLIGSALAPFLKIHGYDVYSIKRNQHPSAPYWDSEQQKLVLNGAPQPDIIIHLAGFNIAQSRWTNEIKEKIVNSRLQSTQSFVDYINASTTPPALFICASAIGFYGETGQKVVDEFSPQGKLFVSELASQWEQMSQQVKQPNTRVVNLRTGVVLSKKEGALAKMLMPFKLGLGGKVGSGRQMMSWIDLQDQLNAILFIINNQQLTGPINLVSPNAVSNETFAKTLATILHRPSLFPLPTFMVKWLFAQMGEELLLASSHVYPTKLLQAGFKFEYASLEKSLKKQLA
jgi:uncharacterized protein (TIGR01777 family)